MRSNDRLGLNCAFSTRKLIVADVSPDCHSYASDKCLEYALDRDKFAKRVYLLVGKLFYQCAVAVNERNLLHCLYFASIDA